MTDLQLQAAIDAPKPGAKDQVLHSQSRTVAKIASILPQARRYGPALAASASVSAAHLVLQVLLLRALDPAEFGLFAFLMVVVQLGYGLSNALIATPYTVLAQKPDAAAPAAASFFAVNALYSAGFAIALGGIGAAFGGSYWVLGFALYGAAAMLRWFARAHAYATFRPATAALSDLVYALVLFAAIAGLWSTNDIMLGTVASALLAATLLGLAMTGPAFPRQQLRHISPVHLVHYGKIWREQSRWALLGVATTEATANAHSYLVIGFAGPTAFAPLAAAALFIKPVSLAVTSLTQIERPVIAKALGERNLRQIDRTQRHFLVAVGLIWLAVSVATALILWFYPEFILRPGYTLPDLAGGAALFAIIGGIRAIQTPDSILLQAADKFRALASFSLQSCFVSITLAACLLWIAGPIWSLGGILLGQAFMTKQIANHANKWRASNV